MRFPLMITNYDDQMVSVKQLILFLLLDMGFTFLESHKDYPNKF